MDNSKEERRIFISYSRKNGDVADKIDSYFKALGITLERDVSDVKYRQSIKKFMRRVNECDFVLMLISKDFLKSENCMFEAMELFSDENFVKRFLPIVLEDAEFYKTEKRLEYVNYWQDEYDKLNEQIRNIKDNNTIGDETRENLKHIDNVRHNIDKFLGIIKDLNAKTLKEHEENKYKEIIEAIGFNETKLLVELMKIQFLTDKDEQFARIEEFLLKHPDHRIGLFLKAFLYSESGKYKIAIVNWTNYLKNYPNDYGAWYNKGKTSGELGKHEEAIKCYNKTIEIKPDYLEAWNNKGTALSDLGKHEEAIKCYDKAIEIKPDYHGAWYNKGKTSGELGKYEEAIKCYDRAIEIKSDDASAWYNKGNALSALNKHEEAIKCYDRAIEIKPDMSEAWYNEGVALSKLGKHEEAIKCYDRAIEIKPDYAIAWYNKACAYSLMKNKPEMLKSLKRAIELDDKHKEKARTEEDFREYWDDPEFLELLM